MSKRVVRTKAELEKAVEEGVEIIVVEGELAEKVYEGRKIKQYGASTLALLGAALAAAPLTAGASLAPIAALTGIDLVIIIIVLAVGLALLLAVWKEYEVVEFSTEPLRLVLRKKA